MAEGVIGDLVSIRPAMGRDDPRVHDHLELLAEMGRDFASGRDVDDLVLDQEGDVARTFKESRYIVEALSRDIDSITQNMDGAARNLYEFTRQIRQNPGLLLGSSAPEDKGGQ